MIHPHTELRFISKEIGYGVFATKLIPKGTITWAYDRLDRSFSAQEVIAMEAVYKDILNTYSYINEKGDFILCWDNAKSLNHSFHSSCITTAYNFELSVRDIHPGEELTDDYGYLNPEEPFKCIPEPHTSRTHVMPDDLLHFYKEWDYKLLAAFERFNEVEQPLWNLIESCYKAKVSDIASGYEEMDSILNTFYSKDRALMAKKKDLLSQYKPGKIVRKEALLNNPVLL